MQRTFYYFCARATEAHTASLLAGAYCLLLFAAGIVELGQPLLSPGSMAYMAAQIGAIFISGTLGSYLGTRGKAQPSKRAATVGSAIYARAVLPLCLLNCLCLVISLLDFWTSGLVGASVSLVDVRDRFSGRTTTILSYVSNLLSPFSAATLGIVIFYFESIPVWLRLFAFISSLATVLGLSVGLGGRYYVLNFLLLLGWWLMVRVRVGKSNLLKRRGLFLIALSFAVGVACLLVGLTVVRSAYRENQGAFMLTLSQRCAIPSQAVLDYTEDINPVVATGVYEALLYWTTSISTFDKVFYHWSMPPTFVSSLSPIVERRLVSLGLIPSPEERYEEWAVILQGYGIFPNGWATVSFNLVESFGKVGGFLFSMVFALFAGYLFARACSTMNFLLLFLSSLCWLFFVLWFQRPITLEPMYEYGVYFAVIAWVSQKQVNNHHLRYRNRIGEDPDAVASAKAEVVTFGRGITRSASSANRK